jgi:hypothetical protein
LIRWTTIIVECPSQTAGHRKVISNDAILTRVREVVGSLAIPGS